jgi:hypothetical protein
MLELFKKLHLFFKGIIRVLKRDGIFLYIFLFLTFARYFILILINVWKKKINFNEFFNGIVLVDFIRSPLYSLKTITLALPGDLENTLFFMFNKDLLLSIDRLFKNKIDFLFYGHHIVFINMCCFLSKEDIAIAHTQKFFVKDSLIDLRVNILSNIEKLVMNHELEISRDLKSRFLLQEFCVLNEKKTQRIRRIVEKEKENYFKKFQKQFVDFQELSRRNSKVFSKIKKFKMISLREQKAPVLAKSKNYKGGIFVYEDGRKRKIPYDFSSGEISLINFPEVRFLSTYCGACVFQDKILLDSFIYNKDNRIAMFFSKYFDSDFEKFVETFDLNNFKNQASKVIILGGVSENYFHFWLDVIGSYLLIKKMLGEEKIKDYKVVFSCLSDKIPKFIKEILDLLDIKTGDEIDLRKKRIDTWQFTDSLSTGISTSCNIPSSHVIKIIRDAVFKKEEYTIRKNKRIFFIRLGYRGIKKEEEKKAIQIAEKFGFLCLNPAKMSVSDQIEVLKDCEVFMSIVGASCTNFIFAPKRCKFIMIGSAKWFRHTFTSFSHTLEGELHLILSELENEFTFSLGNWHRHNMRFPMSNFEKSLEKIIAP